VSGADESVYPPTPGTESSVSCSVVLSNFSARDRAGTQITAEDILALVAADPGIAPTSQDRLVVAGATYQIEEVMTVKPGGVPLLYKCRVRRS
jgi:hypothetical protein